MPAPRLDRQKLVPPARFELTTCGLGNRRSILLSYGGNGVLLRPARQPVNAIDGVDRSPQFACSGGSTGSSKGATDTPSSISAFASSTVA